MGRPKTSDRARAEAAADSPPAESSDGIDAVLDGLDAVVRELEGGDLPLEVALARFEQGVALARRGGKMLDDVEERVERLLADRDETVEFETEDER